MLLLSLKPASDLGLKLSFDTLLKVPMVFLLISSSSHVHTLPP